MTSKGYALARAALIRTLTAYSGITTENGEADGTTLVDSNLKGRNDFITEKTILIMSGDAKDEDKGAKSFDNSDGKITLQGTGFSAQIKAGTIYRVLNISTVEMDVANIKTVVDAIKLQTDKIAGKMLFPKNFWSAAQATAQITATPGTVALPSVTPSLPNGVTITRAIAMMKFRKVSNGDAAANYIDTTTDGPHDPALQVDKAAAGYIDALLLPDTFLRVEGDGIEGGDVWAGDTDIKAKVESGVATTFQLGDDLRCLATTLDLYDIQVGLGIWYSV